MNGPHVVFLSDRKFLNECPSGLITLHEFRRHFCDGTVGMASAQYAEQIFHALDNNGVWQIMHTYIDFELRKNINVFLFRKCSKKDLA